MALARTILPLLLVLAALAPAAWSQPGGSPRIDELSFLDKQYMQQQRATIEDLARTNFGTGFSGDKDHDLALLQRLLDERVVRDDQTRELQAMGLIMGDLLAEDLDMQWVIYEDNLGRSRALRYLESDNYLFPMTMISRRREAGNQRPVAEIYQKAIAAIDEVRTPLPFQ